MTVTKYSSLKESYPLYKERISFIFLSKIPAALAKTLNNLINWLIKLLSVFVNNFFNLIFIYLMYDKNNDIAI